MGLWGLFLVRNTVDYGYTCIEGMLRKRVKECCGREERTEGVMSLGRQEGWEF